MLKWKKKVSFDNSLPILLLGCYFFVFQAVGDWEKVFPFSTQISWHCYFFPIIWEIPLKGEDIYDYNLQLLWDDKYHDETEEISH